ncbi:MAG: hypothetical protein AAF589_02210 [Planctomycetota bacterium]
MPHPAYRILFCCTLLLAGGWSTPALSTEAASVVAATRSDDVYKGTIDARTDDSTLWLRLDSANMSVATSVAWDSIAQISIGNKQVEPADLQAKAGRLASVRPAIDILLGPAILQPRLAPQDRAACGIRNEGCNARCRVASIAITARVANWDADARTDGIEIEVAAMDRFGRRHPVRGELTVTLTGRRQTSRHVATTERLHRWSESVEAHHFGPNGQAAVYRLPYRALDPERNPRIGDAAIVEASLGVFGQGRFAARTPVALRPYPEFTDRLEEQTGQLRFPLP